MKFHPNQKMVTFKGKIFWRENLTGGEVEFKKKNENLQNADAK